MSNKNMLYFLVFFFVISSFALGQTKYPYGAYIYDNHGFEAGEINNLHNNWNNWFKFNSYYFSLTEYEGHVSANYSQDYYEKINLIKNSLGAFNSPIFSSYNLYSLNTCFGVANRAPGITELAEGHYLKINKVYDNYSISDDREDFIKVPFASDYLYHVNGSPGIYVFNDSPLPSEISVVEDIQIKGSEDTNGKYNNYHSFRPRAFNTTKIGNTYKANFILKLDISVLSSDIKDKLTISLKNQRNPSAQNDTLLETTLTLMDADGKTEIPFHLTWVEGNVYDAYAIGPKLNINAFLTEGSEFVINSITIYDSIGKAIVEDDYLNNNPHGYTRPYNYNTIINNFLSFSNPIIALGDETTIGNFPVMQKILEFIESKSTSGNYKYFISSPEGITEGIIKRAFDSLGTEKMVLGVNPYRIKPEDTVYSSYYNKLINKDFSGSFNAALTRVKEIADDYANEPELVSIPQAHEWSNLRLPTKNEIITQAYISLLNNYKGIYFWQMHQSYDYRNIYTRYDTLIHNNLWDFLKADTCLTNYSETGNDAESPFLTIGNFLNADIPNSGVSSVTNIGDLLHESDITKSLYFGYNSNSIEPLNFGDFSTAALTKAEIVNPNTGLVYELNDKLVGIGAFIFEGDQYFLISNLNYTSSDIKLRLILKSTSSDFLKVHTLSSDESVSYRYHPADATVLLELDKKQSVILKVENVETASYGFPKESRFGVARVEGDSTRIILDNNFSSVPGSPEEFEFTVPGTSNKIFTTVYKNTKVRTDDFQDIGAFYYQKVYIGSSKWYASLKYDIYKQNGSTNRYNKFSFDTRKTAGTTTVFHSNFDVFPLVADFNNDGNTDFYYAIRDDQNDRVIARIGYSTLTYPTAYYSSDASVLVTQKNDSNAICIYANNSFHYDFDMNGTIDSSRSMSNGANILPFVGDWANNPNGNDSDYEYGIYSQDNWHKLAFRMNYFGTDPYSYFEFCYGDPGDKPIVWEPFFDSQADDEIGIEKKNLEELSYDLSSYPNPFNPVTNIAYSLPDKGMVNITVYDVLGRKVKTLVHETKDAGKHEVRFDGSSLSSGVYFCRITANKYTSTYKLLLIK